MDNSLGYDRAVDLTFGVGRAQTSLVATFTGEDDGDELNPDTPICSGLDRLHELLGTRREGPSFSLSVTFPGESGKPSYRFFPNQRQPDTAGQFSRLHKQLVTDLLTQFSLHYVPSAKSIADLYDELLNPVLRSIAAAAIQPQIAAIEQELSRVAGYLNDVFRSAGLEGIRASFEFPGGSPERLLSGFDLMLADRDRTTVFRKGQGIQSTALLASFLWITRVEAERGRNTIWLLEEPESYLHPELSQAALAMLEQVRSEALVVLTTHSLAFVPTDPTRTAGTVLTECRTRVEAYKTYVEATEKLRRSLGVRFSDYFNLGVYNVLLEGPSDREFVQWARELLPARDAALVWPQLTQAELLDFGGVRHLAGFLRATFPFIRVERTVVAVFDGDAAGSKERRDLQQFLGQAERFRLRQIVILSPFAIGLRSRGCSRTTGYVICTRSIRGGSTSIRLTVPAILSLSRSRRETRIRPSNGSKRKPQASKTSIGRSDGLLYECRRRRACYQRPSSEHRRELAVIPSPAIEWARS